ncbi:bifunctional riboflavin kinase/FMN phosphatase [Jatropha curcas]|uniref:bifunctional riboflavin kinase/FMN phosphatase n=1 Tax=Jatropha curcas TaxID=180498 RepID=UPI0009D6DA5F|nr:bifunctional riboflavin kinase/FMN phosphatase [Jatropha curcas]
MGIQPLPFGALIPASMETLSNSESCNGESKVYAVILDLDGTLLDTESATKGVLKEFLAKYGKELDKEREESKRLGMTLQDSAVAIVKDYGLPLTPDQFIHEIMPMYRHRWSHARALPGANRLIKHLWKNGVPIALASNSSTENIDAKISHQQGWKYYFSTILGSNQVKSGKPSPDIFIEAARRMGVDAAKCLVIEDSLVGVKAAKAAKMKVVAVPSQSEADCSLLADSVLHSLLEFQPEIWGLPPFDDWVDSALPIEPIYLSILYKNGSISEVTGTMAGGGESGLPCQVSGLYFGWTQSGVHGILKVLVGIGGDHCSCSAKRNIQICTIDEKNDDVCDEQMQLVLVGYIRKLDSKEVDEEDMSIASCSLDKPIFINLLPCVLPAL